MSVHNLLHRHHKDYGQNLKEVRAIHLEEVRANCQMASSDCAHTHRYYGDYQTPLQEKRVWNVSAQGKQRKLQPSHYHYADEW